MGKNLLQPPQSEMKVNIWEIKPPDFSYKLYTSMRFPEKPSRTIKEEQKRIKSNFPETVLHLPRIRNHPEKAVSPKFITTFPHVDSYKAKLMFVESGKYPNGVYLNPKPRDFRQYQRNLPNFVTTYERDPFGLKFKSRNLSTVHGCQLLKDDKHKNNTERFITYKPRESTWDPKLLLPKAPWPIKSASYTVSVEFWKTTNGDVIISGFRSTVGAAHIPSVFIIPEHFRPASKVIVCISLPQGSLGGGKGGWSPRAITEAVVYVVPQGSPLDSS